MHYSGQIKVTVIRETRRSITPSSLEALITAERAENAESKFLTTSISRRPG
jgi:hypothetical protein